MYSIEGALITIAFELLILYFRILSSGNAYICLAVLVLNQFRVWRTHVTSKTEDDAYYAYELKVCRLAP